MVVVTSFRLLAKITLDSEAGSYRGELSVESTPP